MEIIYHAHHAVISDYMRRRVERRLGKLAARLDHAVDAVVRFEQDGPVRRVEVMLHAARRNHLVAEGFGRTYGPALTQATNKLETQIRRLKRTGKSRARTRALLSA
ncbi:MAG TPA: HPF/RaiA family ribosome-associated protein [Gemmatimonadaceae bacterium]|nr:HPF/RaiA family ribosome-associated protein [Gemmatimonadaceae bacterium]